MRNELWEHISVNRNIQRITREILIVILLVFLSGVPRAEATFYHFNFIRDWEESFVVASGTVTILGDDNIENRAGKYRLQANKYYKGATANNEIFFDENLHDPYRYIKGGSDYLGFFSNSSQGDGNKNKDKIIGLWLFSASGDESIEIISAISKYKKYKKIADNEERKAYLLEQLEDKNKYLWGYFLEEIMVYNVTESILFFEKRLLSGSESERLHAVFYLKRFGRKDIYLQLIQWLKDPDWEENRIKCRIIRSLSSETTNSEKVIPAIRAFINSKDEMLAVTARIALFNLGVPDGKSLLFDILKISNHRGRHNAMFTLESLYYNETFTKDEIELIREISNDKNDQLSRRAGFLLENIERGYNPMDFRE